MISKIPYKIEDLKPKIICDEANKLIIKGKNKLKVATHVTASLSIMQIQFFCTSMHNFPLSPHGTSMLEKQDQL